MTTKNIFSKILAFAFFATLSTFMLSCNSVPDEIPYDLDASQLIQKGQDSFDAKNYKASEKYFSTVLERYGDDPKHFIEATYELGHLYMKTKQYEKAYRNFNDILKIYENVPMGLPGSYKILCQLELKKIPQKALEAIEGKPQETEEELSVEEPTLPEAKPLPVQIEY